MEVSKELLSEVLFGGRVQIKGFGINGAILDYSLYCSINEKDGTDFNKDIPDNYYVQKRNIYEDINIYELVHKCKEWASKHHYSVMSGWEMTHWGGAYHGVVYKNPSSILFSISTIKTEPEAIITACEWILKEINEKQLQH